MYHWAYCRSLQRAINCKIPLNAPFVILNTGKEENIHFAVSRRIFKQTRKNNFTIKKEKVAIKFLMTVLLFGLFVMFANLNPITTIAWNSTSCAYSKTEKWVKLQEKCRNCRNNCSIFRISDRSSTEKERKNKAPQSKRTSIVIAIVFLKQRRVSIMSRDLCGNLAEVFLRVLRFSPLLKNQTFIWFALTC